MEQQLNVTHKWHKIRDTINQRMPFKLTRTYAKLRIMKWIFQQQQKWTTELRFACKCALFVFGELEGSRTLESEIIFDFNLHLQARDLTSYHHHCVRNTYTVISCIIYVYDVVALNELIRDMCMCWLRNFHLTHKRNSFCSTGSHKIIIFVSNHLYDYCCSVPPPVSSKRQLNSVCCLQIVSRVPENRVNGTDTHDVWWKGNMSMGTCIWYESDEREKWCTISSWR